MHHTQMATQERVTISQDGLLSKVASYLRGLFGQRLGVPVSARNRVVGGTHRNVTNYFPIYPVCGEWFSEELWSLLSEEERLRAMETRPW